MYVIIVYDISQERVNKVCKFLRTYLNWVQNSVFEGELTESNLQRVKARLSDLIDNDADSILIYEFSSRKLMTRGRIGIEKSPISNIV